MTTAVVICPGRGSYNASEFGYLSHRFPDSSLLSEFDAIRIAAGQESLSALDGAARFSHAWHTRGDNAAGLIFAAGLGDFLSLTDVEIVAVTGNSMGWYTALACAGGVCATDGFRIANTMGTLMHRASIGGQTLYPWMDQDWNPDTARKAQLMQLVAEINAVPEAILALSIDLGGFLVLAGNTAGLAAFEGAVPVVQGRYPMRLGNHAAFHTVMQDPVAAQGRAALPISMFGQPSLPLIDGRGHIWWPNACSVMDIYDYTLGAQVTQRYDFTRAITTAAREFAPDIFILLGPGGTLGGAIAQSLIMANWKGMKCKSDFKEQQNTAPVLRTVGIA